MNMPKRASRHHAIRSFWFAGAVRVLSWCEISHDDKVKNVNRAIRKAAIVEFGFVRMMEIERSAVPWLAQ
jgi:hypothetical protein